MPVCDQGCDWGTKYCDEYHTTKHQDAQRLLKVAVELWNDPYMRTQLDAGGGGFSGLLAALKRADEAAR